jgi:hypothetical protein
MLPAILSLMFLRRHPGLVAALAGIILASLV